ncbi:MAG: winged helix-turn-helix domain-containing protein, partial [Phycisphaerales bacterium]
RPPGWRSPIQDADTLRKIMRLLARETPREIVKALARQPTNVSTLAENIGRPVSTVRANLDRLAKAHLVEVSKVKPKHVYRLSDQVTVRDHATKMRVSVQTPRGSTISLQFSQPPG